MPIDASQLETPLSIQHVESHLFFGPISRRFALGHILLLSGIVWLAVSIFGGQKTFGARIGNIIGNSFWLVLPFLLLKMTKRQQAIIGWMAIKFAMGFGAFIMATVGAGSSFQQGNKTDACVFLLLGLIWIPSVEFIPRITPHQKYVTLARIVFSIPLICLGISGGNWHWN